MPRQSDTQNVYRDQMRVRGDVGSRTFTLLPDDRNPGRGISEIVCLLYWNSLSKVLCNRVLKWNVKR